MNIRSKTVTVAYKCPNCGRTVFAPPGLFTLSGDMFKIKCDCEDGSELIIRREKGKINISCPCLICRSGHSFSLDENTDLPKVIACGCPLSGIKICFIGEKEDIDEEVFEADDEFCGILEENGFESLGEFIQAKKQNERNGASENPMGGIEKVSAGELATLVGSFLTILREEDGILCGCSPEEQKLAVSYAEDGLLISCENCGGKHTVPFSTLLDPYSLAEIDSIYLS